MIKYCYETGIIECVATIEEVEKFIRGEMSKFDFIYRHQTKSEKTACDPVVEAKRRNLNIARSIGIKNSEQFEKAITERSVHFWYVYRQDNTKRFVDPFGKE